MSVKEPEHQLPALTTYELNDYRRDLEGAVASPATDARELPGWRPRDGQRATPSPALARQSAIRTTVSR